MHIVDPKHAIIVKFYCINIRKKKKKWLVLLLKPRDNYFCCHLKLEGKTEILENRTAPGRSAVIKTELNQVAPLLPAKQQQKGGSWRVRRVGEHVRCTHIQAHTHVRRDHQLFMTSSSLKWKLTRSRRDNQRGKKKRCLRGRDAKPAVLACSCATSTWLKYHLCKLHGTTHLWPAVFSQ